MMKGVMAQPLSYKQSEIAMLLFLHAINALLALIAIMEKDVAFDYRAWFFLYSAFVFGYSLVNKLDNVLFATRTLFLGAVGYYPMLIKTIDPEGMFSLFEPSTQGWDVVAMMYGLTSFALFGSEIGLLAGRIGMPRQSLSNIKFDELNYKILFFCSIVLVIFIAYLTAESAGPSLFTASYASEAQGQLLGNTQAMGIIGLLSMVLAINRTNISFAKPLMIISVLYFLVWAMFFHGLRQDVLTALLGMYAVHSIARGKPPRIGMTGVMALVTLVLVFELWGTMRSSLATDGFDPLAAMELISSQFGISHVYQISTLSAIDTTVANTIYLIQNGQVDFLYGQTFLEFILRTPPEFLYPDRPRDYAWMFQDYGLVACGGFHELAEAYLNFGVAGVFFVPLILSFLISKAYWGACVYQTAWRYFLLFSFIGIWMRGTWYQIFAFYKTFLTAIILFGCFWAIVSFAQFVRLRKIHNPSSEQNTSAGLAVANQVIFDKS